MDAIRTSDSISSHARRARRSYMTPASDSYSSTDIELGESFVMSVGLRIKCRNKGS